MSLRVGHGAARHSKGQKLPTLTLALSLAGRGDVHPRPIGERVGVQSSVTSYSLSWLHRPLRLVSSGLT